MEKQLKQFKDLIRPVDPNQMNKNIYHLVYLAEFIFIDLFLIIIWCLLNFTNIMVFGSTSKIVVLI